MPFFHLCIFNVYQNVGYTFRVWLVKKMYRSRDKCKCRLWGLVVLYRSVSHHLLWQHPIWMPVSVLSASLSIQLLLMCIGKQQMIRPPLLCGSLGRSSWFLASTWPSSGSCGHLGSKLVDEKSLSSLSLTQPFKY